MDDLHVFDNGVRLHRSHLLPQQLERYALVNLHEPVEEEWVKRLAASVGGAPGVFVDIGAAVGYYCFLVHQLNPAMELHAFEPFAENRSHLEENRLVNGSPVIHVHPEAIAAKAGTAVLQGAGFQAYLAPGRGGTIVATTTIDAVAAAIGRPIDLLKMDIQGGEAEALAGAADSFRLRRVRNWIVGTHSPQIHAACLRTFERYSYRVLFESPTVEHQPDGMVVAATGRR